MADYYNPLDVFKTKEAVEYIGKSIDEAKSSSIFSTQSIQSVQDFVENSLFTKYIAFPNPIGSLFNIGYWSTNRTLKSLTYEQLELLNDANINIENQVKISLVLSTINLYMASSLKKKTNEITDYGLKEVSEKDKKYMWDLCRFPLALLLNYACYNKSCKDDRIKPVLLDILQNAIASTTIEELCKKHFLILGNETLQDYIVEKFDNIERYYEKYNDSLPTFQVMMNIAKRYKDLITDI